MAVTKLINLGSLCLFTVMLASGQLLFKRLGLAMRGQPLLDGFWLIARMPSLYLALALYGLSTVLWIWILSRVSLARAYPWVAVGVVIVPLIGRYYFGEQLHPLFWVGVALIFAGIFLVQGAAGAGT
jgi:multidrug transporter EmrE-like cation transporter